MGEHTMGDDVNGLVRLSTPLGGGVVGTMQEMCGALSGGLLLIGAMYGRDTPSGDDTASYRLAGRYLDQFRAELGGTQCARLRATVVQGSGGLGSCGPLVERAATMLVEIVDRAADEE